MLRHQLEQESYSDATLEKQLRIGALPKHVAIIMDGNGRWATERGFSRIAGHREGVESAREVVSLCRDLGISALTLYAFSLENWKRPREEVDCLMELFSEFFYQHCRQFLQEGVRFRAIGRLELLPQSIQVMIKELEETTQNFNQLTVTLALSYGGRDEILTAVNKIIRDNEDGIVEPGSLNETGFSRYLSTAELPDPDLVIRTSGESRISNFLLWQIAYSELYFTKTLWPDFRRREMLLALLDYQARERRLGGLSLKKDQCELPLHVSSTNTFFYEGKSGQAHQVSSPVETQWYRSVGVDSDYTFPAPVFSWLD